MIGDQDMWCREENFIVFRYVLRSIVRPWNRLRDFSRSKTRTRLLLYLSLAGFVCGFSLLNPSVANAGEYEENSVCGNSGRRKGLSGQRLRLRNAGSCKAQILKTRVDFLETRSELFQKQVR